MRKRLTSIGSSLGIIIDKPVLDLLKITPETEIEIETDGQNIILKPDRVADNEKAMKAYKRVAKRHKKSLRKLSK